MKKKILIGSLLVLTLLLLMPSIPAIQQNTIEEKAYSDFVEKLDDIDFEDIEILDDMRHPVLYALVVFILCSRMDNILKLFDIAVTVIEWEWYFEWDVHHPFLLLIVILMAAKLSFRMILWRNISNKLGWGWIMDYSIFDDYIYLR